MTGSTPIAIPTLSNNSSPFKIKSPKKKNNTRNANTNNMSCLTTKKVNKALGTIDFSVTLSDNDEDDSKYGEEDNDSFTSEEEDEEEILLTSSYHSNISHHSIINNNNNMNIDSLDIIPTLNSDDNDDASNLGGGNSKYSKSSTIGIGDWSMAGTISLVGDDHSTYYGGGGNGSVYTTTTTRTNTLPENNNGSKKKRKELPKVPDLCPRSSALLRAGRRLIRTYTEEMELLKEQRSHHHHRQQYGNVLPIVKHQEQQENEQKQYGNETNAAARKALIESLRLSVLFLKNCNNTNMSNYTNDNNNNFANKGINDDNEDTINDNVHDDNINNDNDNNDTYSPNCTTTISPPSNNNNNNNFTASIIPTTTTAKIPGYAKVGLTEAGAEYALVKLDLQEFLCEGSNNNSFKDNQSYIPLPKENKQKWEEDRRRLRRRIGAIKHKLKIRAAAAAEEELALLQSLQQYHSRWSSTLMSFQSGSQKSITSRTKHNNTTTTTNSNNYGGKISVRILSLLRSLGAAYDGELCRYDHALRCYEEVLEIELAALATAKKRMDNVCGIIDTTTTTKKKKRSSGTSNTTGSNTDAASGRSGTTNGDNEEKIKTTRRYKEWVRMVRDTKRKIGLIHHRTGKFDLAMIATFA